MIYELCSQAAQFITDRHQDMERGKQTSLEDQRRKRGQEEEKVSCRGSHVFTRSLPVTC